MMAGRLSTFLMVLFALLVSSRTFAGIGPPPPLPPGPHFVYTFTESADGTSFSIQGSGMINELQNGSVRGPNLLEGDFGDFLAPALAGMSPLVSGSSGTITLNRGGSFEMATALTIFQGGLNGITFNDDIILTEGGLPAMLSGTIEGISVASFNFPGITTFQQLFNVTGSPYNATLDRYDYQLIFVLTASPATNGGTSGGGGGGGGNNGGGSFITVDAGAITSATTTGPDIMSATLDTVQNAAQNAVGDLNNRLFNARSGGNNDNGGSVTTLDSTSRYLNFAATQNIDYRVALGLADGEEVEVFDTLSPGSGHPLAMAGTLPVVGSKTVIVAATEGSSKNPVSEKVVIEDQPQTRFELFTEFDYGFYDQDNLTRTTSGFETDSYAGSAGLEYEVTPWLMAGAAFTYLQSDTDVTANLGNIDLEGHLLSGYFTAFHGNSYLDVLYSYGDFDDQITRNTLLGRNAYGDTDSHSHNITANLGHTFQATRKLSFGPSVGANYATGQVNGYTERGGGLANLIYPDHQFESMIGRIGGYATYTTETGLGRLTTQARAGWAHEFMQDGGLITTSLETSPFALVTGNNVKRFGEFTSTHEQGQPGTDWLELGATTRLDLQNTGFHFELGYQGMFGRNNASGHFGSAKIGYEW